MTADTRSELHGTLINLGSTVMHTNITKMEMAKNRDVSNRKLVLNSRYSEARDREIARKFANYGKQGRTQGRGDGGYSPPLADFFIFFVIFVKR